MRLSVAKQKAKTTHKIGDKKKRGEWVEMKFMAEAAERGLPTAKPFGDSENFDVVVGRPGKFVGVQVKCTIFRSKNGEGYICSTCSSHKLYRAGAFDFLAAYVVPEDAWYILPAKEIVGMRSVSLCTPDSRWEKYREGWEMLREAVGAESDEDGRGGRHHMGRHHTDVEAAAPPSRMEQRMMGAFNFVRKHWEG